MEVALSNTTKITIIVCISVGHYVHSVQFVRHIS
jgi:hypothetical protein